MKFGAYTIISKKCSLNKTLFSLIFFSWGANRGQEWNKCGVFGTPWKKSHLPHSKLTSAVWVYQMAFFVDFMRLCEPSTRLSVFVWYRIKCPAFLPLWGQIGGRKCGTVDTFSSLFIFKSGAKSLLFCNNCYYLCRFSCLSALKNIVACWLWFFDTVAVLRIVKPCRLSCLLIEKVLEMSDILA